LLAQVWQCRFEVGGGCCDSLPTNCPKNCRRKLGIADSAYASYKKLMLYGGDDLEELAKFKGRLCKFQIINGTFRHTEEKQHIAFLAVAVLVQYELDETATLLDV
jgi:hypothetical protein